MQHSQLANFCVFDRVGTTAVCRVCGRVVDAAPNTSIVAACITPEVENSSDSPDDALLLDGFIANHHAAVLGISIEQPTAVTIENPPVEELSLLQKAKNFAHAAIDHVAAGMPRASEEEIDRRFAICQTCPFLENNTCKKCGCPVNREKKFISKLAWADQKCPDGRW